MTRPRSRPRTDTPVPREPVLADGDPRTIRAAAADRAAALRSEGREFFDAYATLKEELRTTLPLSKAVKIAWDSVTDSYVGPDPLAPGGPS